MLHSLYYKDAFTKFFAKNISLGKKVIANRMQKYDSNVGLKEEKEKSGMQTWMFGVLL